MSKNPMEEMPRVSESPEKEKSPTQNLEQLLF
jgi:hypothetical protein